MAELEETWTNQSFYDLPLSVWTGQDADAKDAPAFDIYTASSIGNFHCIKDILKKNPKVVEEKNKGGWTALMYAAYYGHTEVVTMLLESQSPIHTRNNRGCNALMLSVVCGNEPVVEILIKSGSILETRDQRDWTVLLHAASAGQHNVVETLLKYGANPNACDRDNGMTCLMNAAQTGDQHMVNILLKAGAVTTLKTHRGHTAARIANDAGFLNIASTITQYSHQENVSGPSIFDGPAAVANKWLQQQQQQPQQQQQQQQEQQPPKSRGNSVQTIGNYPVIPSSLEALLEQLSLSTYISVFREQGVDLHLFLTLTDQDLKDCGIQKLGPRRKMTSAISRWHSVAPMRSTLEGAYADKLEVEMQELAVKISDAQGAVQQAKTQAGQEKELRAVTEGWVVEARGRLQQCHQLCGTLKDLVGRAHQYISVVNMQAAVVQHQLGQPTLASTIADTLALIGAQVESISSLTDPNVARGYSNPNTPRVQPTDTSYDSGFTNQPTLHTGANGPKYSNGNPPGPAHGPSGPKYNNGNPPPLHNRPHGPNYNNGHTPRRLHNGPGGSIYNSGGNSPLPSHIVHPSGHRHNNDNIIMNNNFPFSNSPGPYKPSNPHSHFHPHNPQRIINN